MTRQSSLGVALHGKFNKINLENIPKVEPDERATYEKIKALVEAKKKNIMCELSNDEMYKMGRLAAKCHLVNIRDHVKNAKTTMFCIDYAFYFLRLFEFGANKPVIAKSNKPFDGNVFYKGGYADVIDSFFGEPIIKNAHPPYYYTAFFEVI